MLRDAQHLIGRAAAVTPRYRSGGGEPLVLLHCGWMNWRIWMPMLPLLTPGRDVLAPTLPGHLGGPKPPPGVGLTLTNLADWAEAELDRAGFRSPDLTGNSLGANRTQVQFGASDTVGRIAARLVELCERHGHRTPEGIEIRLPITQEDLGGWTGASRASVASALRTMRDIGWAKTERMRITVLDLDSLRARAGLIPPALS